MRNSCRRAASPVGELASLVQTASRFTGALAFRALAPACLRRRGAARGSLAPPPRVRAAALRVCSHGGASRLRADFSLSLRSPRRQAPLFRGFLLAGARRFAFSARAASRSQTKLEFCIIEGSLTGFRPSATPSISEYSKNRAHIVRSGRAIFLRCLQNLRFVWLRLGFGFCAVRHRAIVVLCLFPSFAFLFSLVYAATAPTRDGGRSSVPFLKKKCGFAALFSQKGLTSRRTSVILAIGAYCAGNFPVIRHSP